jgi:hypothetical protein
MIPALARRTASVRVGRFFGDGVLASSPPTPGILGSMGAADEPRAAGCRVMGPADVGEWAGICDNARLPNSFDACAKKPAAADAFS